MSQTVDERLVGSLIKIYIGQNIRDEGILQSNISITIDDEKALIENGLISKTSWYNHNLYVTTSNGTRIARSLIENKIKSVKKEIKNFLASFPIRLTGFLINDYFVKSLDFSEHLPEYFYGEHGPDVWNWHILRDQRIWSKRTEILSKLEKLGLCVKTNYYVSTRGGELRELMYVLTPEVRELLIELSPTYGLTEKESRKCRVYHFLREIENWLEQLVVEELRQKYFDEMQKFSIDEVEIKKVIDRLAEKGVTNSYLGIATLNKKPYNIKDKIGYSIYLQDLLIKPIINDLIEGKPKIIMEKESHDQIKNLQRVVKLVEAKYTLTRNAAILEIDLFGSTPDVEVCITRMLRNPTTEGELKEFIEILYNYVIDRSKKRLLKIGDIKTGQITTFEETIVDKGKSIPPESAADFEKAIQDLRMLNNLRNKLSHSKAAKDWTEIANIYRKLINKPVPQNMEDYMKVQEHLLDKITLSLESLSHLFMKISE